MNGQLNGHNDALGHLATPSRNNYFYGKLLDELHFRMEQQYLNRKRWLLNRLGLGYGVLCGIEVEIAEDGQCVLVRPGVAVDAYGREIIVPQAYCLEDPRQPTDEFGSPEGERITGEGVVTLCLAYHECQAEPVPVLVGDCDTRQDCEPSVVRERYRLIVRQGEPSAPEPFPCEAIFPPEPADDFDRRRAACEALSGPCSTPDDVCVVLATVVLPENEDDAVTVDACTWRRVVYSNARLLELLLCLAARVDACCSVRIVRYVSGDAQLGATDAQLPEPLIVEVVDGTGTPVAGETVDFEVRGGGGAVEPASTETDENGRAEVSWQMGAAPGLNTVEARLETGSHVVFHALAEGEQEEDEGEDEETAFNVVQFDQNSTELSEEASALLERNLEILREQPELCVGIEGSALQNERDAPTTAQQRADIIAEFYGSRDIPRDRMSTSSVVQERGPENRRVMTRSIPCDEV